MAIFNSRTGLSRTTRAKRFAAVDFDSQTVRMVLAESGPKGANINKIACVAVPSGMDMTNPMALGAFLRLSLHEHLGGVSNVLMCLSRAQVVLKPIVLPPATEPSEMASMVHFQVGKELPFAVEEAVIDFTVEAHYSSEAPAEAEKGVEVLVAAARVPTVDFFRKCAEAGGFKLLALGLRPYANLNCILACLGGFDKKIALVQLGANEAEIDVIHGGLAFSRSVGMPNEENRDLAVNSLAAEITRSVQSYQTIQRGDKAESIVIAGATGMESALAVQLGRKLALPASVLDPSAALGLGQHIKNSSGCCAAIGMAIGYCSDKEPPYDFLNPKRPPVVRDTRRTKILAAFTTAIILIITSVAGGWLYLGSKQTDVNLLSTTLKDVKTKNDHMRALEKVLAGAENWNKGNSSWLDQWTILSASLPGAQDVYVNGGLSTSDGSLSLTMQARNSDLLETVKKNLLALGCQITPESYAGNTDRFGYPHGLKLKVKMPATMPAIDASAVSQRPSDDMSVDAFYQPVAVRTPPAPPPDVRSQPTPTTNAKTPAATQPGRSDNGPGGTTTGSGSYTGRRGGRPGRGD